VIFYADSGGSPGTPLAGCSYPAASYTTLGEAFNIALPTACLLKSGQQSTVYWVSVQGNMVPSGTDWGWRDRSVQSGNGANAEYPGEGSVTCPTWNVKQNCFHTTVGVDECFSISGTGSIFRDGFE